MAWRNKNGYPVYNSTTLVLGLDKIGSIIFPKGTFSFQYTNVGTCIATVNNQVIYPGVPGTSLGTSRSIAAHEGELYTGEIVLQFNQPTAGLICLVEFVFLTYCDE